MAELKGRELIASRCAKFFKDGDFVNLGIGLPLMCVNYLPEGVDLWLEAEIGTVGSGATPKWGEEDIDVIDAGGQPASVIKGGSVCDHETSFAYIRGGHIDAAVLGTLQVDEEGNIANWTIPGKLVPGMGGAMDLCAGVKRIIVATDHCEKSGRSKILKEMHASIDGRKMCYGYRYRTVLFPGWRRRTHLERISSRIYGGRCAGVHRGESNRTG